MSPHVGTFVADLVEMAKATEELPRVQQELDDAKRRLEQAQNTIQDRELAIIDYKHTIDDLQAKLRTTEASRDDAEMRFLELEERLAALAGMFKAAAVHVDLVVQDKPKAEEPKAEPVPEVVQSIEPVDPYQSEAPINTEAVNDQGQSERPPTASLITDMPVQSALNKDSVLGHQEDAISQTVQSEPSPGPYFGKRYYDHPVYVSLSDWLKGGGTEADYQWRPIRQSVF